MTLAWVSRKCEAEQILDLSPVDLPGPVPLKLIEALEHGEAGGLDPPLDAAGLAPMGFALDQAGEIVDVGVALSGGLLGERLEVLAHVGQLQGGEVGAQRRYAGQLSWSLRS